MSENTATTRTSEPGVVRRGSLGRVATVVVAALVTVLCGVSPAAAAVTSVTFADELHVAALGQPFEAPVAVLVQDENGPVEDVEVTFTVSPDSTGATALLSAPTGVTDADGVARVSVTAGDSPGFPQLQATAEGVSASTQLVNRPPGYLPGEKLAAVEGLNQDGVIETVGEVTGRKPFLLVDVCASWCGPCRIFAQETEVAIARLAMVGVDVQLVTLLADGDDPYEPSTQADALAWKQSLGLSGSVLHADGSRQSELYRSAYFALYAEGDAAFPTHLLVDPRGRILDRRVGLETSDQTVERVLQYAKTTQQNRPEVDAGEVGVVLPDGTGHSHRFADFGQESFDWGGLWLEGADSPNAVARTWTYLPNDLAVVVSEGSVELSLTRFGHERGQRLATSTVRVGSTMVLWDGADPVVALSAATRVPATQRGGTVTVAVDLPDLRQALRTELEAGRYQVTYGYLDGPLTSEQIDALVYALYTFVVTADYVRR